MSEYFTITRELNAPAESVFDVLVTPEHFADWFGSRAVSVPLETLTMDVRPGGAFVAVMHLPDGNLINWIGQFAEVLRPTRMSMSLSDSPEHAPGVPISFTVTETPSGSKLEIKQHRGDFSQEQVDATIAGYNTFIDTMVDILGELDGAH